MLWAGADWRVGIQTGPGVYDAATPGQRWIDLDFCGAAPGPVSDRFGFLNKLGQTGRDKPVSDVD
jgi:hypothetical protein